MLSKLALGGVRAAAAKLVGIEAPAKLADVRRTHIAIVAFAVRRAAVLHRTVVAFISGATEVRGAWITVVTIFTGIAAPGELNLIALVRVRQTDRLCAGIVVIRALV